MEIDAELARLDEKLARLQARFEKEREELLVEHAVRKALPDYARQREARFHACSLYGAEAWLTWEYDFHRYDPEGKKPPQLDLEFLLRLGQDLLPVPLVMVRNSCLSFRTQTHVDSLPEEQQQRFGSVTPLAPFTVKIRSLQQQTASFAWYTRLAERTVECHVELPLYQLKKLGKLTIHTKKRLGETVVKECTFSPGEASELLLRDGATVAEMGKPIRWASGSPHTPNDFTLFWYPYAGKLVTVADLARQLLPDERS